VNSTTVKQGQVPAEELRDAHKTIQAFVTAFKSYSLYPEDHVFSRTNLEKFKTQLEAFLEIHEELPLVIVKNTFLYEGEMIFDAPPEENNPAYLLTRDGLIHLDFLRGIESEEIATLLKILKQHRSAGDESGGDIVTSLWQAEFQHVEYEEVDIFALEAFNFDLGTLKVAADDAPLMSAINTPVQPEQANDQNEAVKTLAETTGEETEQDQSVVQSETVTNLLRMEQALKVLEITPEEKLILKSYVEDEEHKDYTNDVIDVLLIILISQKNKLHFTHVLEFLGAVFFDSLNNGHFHLAYKLCSNVLTIRNQLKSIRPWTLDLVDDFISSLSAEEQWAEVSWVKNPNLLVILYLNHQKYLWHVLRLLTPNMILTLGPLMGSIDTGKIDVRNELYELIENKAKKDPDKLNSLLSRSDENINLLLFPIVEHLSRMDAAKISLQMTRHDSVEVRKTGLNGYFTYTASPDFEVLFPLLNDDDDVIVGKLLTFLLSQAESEVAEGVLLRFLEQAVAEGAGHAHMFEYYKALSQCGSLRSVKVLEKILMESRISEMFSDMNAVHKKGSALALKILGFDEALNVLDKGKKSLRPDIRMACQFALGKIK